MFKSSTFGFVDIKACEECLTPDLNTSLLTYLFMAVGVACICCVGWPTFCCFPSSSSGDFGSGLATISVPSGY